MQCSTQERPIYKNLVVCRAENITLQTSKVILHQFFIPIKRIRGRVPSMDHKFWLMQLPQKNLKILKNPLRDLKAKQVFIVTSKTTISDRKKSKSSYHNGKAATLHLFINGIKRWLAPKNLKFSLKLSIKRTNAINVTDINVFIWHSNIKDPAQLQQACKVWFKEDFISNRYLQKNQMHIQILKIQQLENLALKCSKWLNPT